MQNLLTSLNTILTAGIGGVSFFTAWVYLASTWLKNLDLDVIPFLPWI